MLTCATIIPARHVHQHQHQHHHWFHTLTGDGRVLRAARAVRDVWQIPCSLWNARRHNATFAAERNPRNHYNRNVCVHSRRHRWNVAFSLQSPQSQCFFGWGFFLHFRLSIPNSSLTIFIEERSRDSFRSFLLGCYTPTVSVFIWVIDDIDTR